MAPEVCRKSRRSVFIASRFLSIMVLVILALDLNHSVYGQISKNSGSFVKIQRVSSMLYLLLLSLDNINNATLIFPLGEWVMKSSERSATRVVYFRP